MGRGSRRRIRNELKGSSNERLLHVLQVGFVCSVIVSIFKCTNPDPDILATFSAVWLVSLKCANIFRKDIFIGDIPKWTP